MPVCCERANVSGEQKGQSLPSGTSTAMSESAELAPAKISVGQEAGMASVSEDEISLYFFLAMGGMLAAI